MTGSTLLPLPGVDLPAPRWWLAPGVSLLWRGDGSFQLEHADGGVMVAGLDRTVAAALARPRREAGAHGLVPSDPDPPPAPPDLAALHRLAELGLVHTDRAADPAGDDTADDDPGLDAPVPFRPSGTTRRDSRVDIVGITRVAAYVGALLGAAGVGQIGFASAGVVRRRDLLPGGLAAADEGRRFAAAAADVVARAAPRTDIAPPVAGEPDLVVVCLEAPMEPELRELLQRKRWAHLAVHVDAARGEIGPLVLPGVSACLRCADLHRLDHDPA